MFFQRVIPAVGPHSPTLVELPWPSYILSLSKVQPVDKRKKHLNKIIRNTWNSTQTMMRQISHLVSNISKGQISQSHASISSQSNTVVIIGKTVNLTVYLQELPNRLKSTCINNILKQLMRFRFQVLQCLVRKKMEDKFHLCQSFLDELIRLENLPSSFIACLCSSSKDSFMRTQTAGQI